MMVSMDPAIHRGEMPLADRYRRFARREARGVSLVYEPWAVAVAGGDVGPSPLNTPPPGQQPPDLGLAAARLDGADSTYGSFRPPGAPRWEEVRGTISARATQTNEAGRCAVLLPFLAELPQPLALIEVGASAGLCLLPDRYSYRSGDRPATDHRDATAQVTRAVRRHTVH